MVSKQTLVEVRLSSRCFGVGVGVLTTSANSVQKSLAGLRFAKFPTQDDFIDLLRYNPELCLLKHVGIGSENLRAA